MTKWFVLAAVLVLGAAGCRFKGGESFVSATTPVTFEPVKGDPYANGGIASATGGTKPATNYGKGADPKSTGRVSSYDQPAKGIGQQPGEPMINASAGHGNTNAPAFQASPSASGNPSTR